MLIPNIRGSISTYQKRIFISEESIAQTLENRLNGNDIQIILLDSINKISSHDQCIDLFLLSENFCRKREKEVTDFFSGTDRSQIYFLYISSGFPQTCFSDFIHIVIPGDCTDNYLFRTVKNAFQSLLNNINNELLERALKDSNSQITELSNIGQQLMMEKDLKKLLDLILLKSRELATADAGSLYLAETDADNNKNLRFIHTQNDSVAFEFQEFVMPISKKSIAGFVAETGNMLNLKDVYALPEESQFSFNPSFDVNAGYRTKSMLILPLKDYHDEVIGVLQLINRKKNWESRLDDSKESQANIIDFSGDCINTVSALAGQAAVAIENNLLYQNIEKLFEGFVKASVTAIESRDPTTSGHSSRVAALTVKLAEVVDKSNTGPLKDICFSKDQIKEIRYASLLHDFGKVAVKEDVLLKAKKLYPSQLTDVLHRFNHKKHIEKIIMLQKKLDYIKEHGLEQSLQQNSVIEEEYKQRIEKINKDIEFILKVNEPAITETAVSNKLHEIAVATYTNYELEETPILSKDEMAALSIKRGSLGELERKEIESHVAHTFKFLKEVPWTKELINIPNIAHAHHEKLDGSGYPNNLEKDQIPVQAKMMTISDIFDALTASDRPYKKAVHYEKALDILKYEVEDNHINADLLDIFVEAEIYKTVLSA